MNDVSSSAPSSQGDRVVKHIWSWWWIYALSVLPLAVALLLVRWQRVSSSPIIVDLPAAIPFVTVEHILTSDYVES